MRSFAAILLSVALMIGALATSGCTSGAGTADKGVLAGNVRWAAGARRAGRYDAYFTAA